MKLKSLAFVCVSVAVANAASPVHLPNGLTITPSAVPHSVELALNPHLAGQPGLTLGQPVTTALSPDGKQLLTLTTGYNKQRGKAGTDTNEYVFVYDVTAFPPKQVQALPVPNTFCGLAWNPNGNEFYVSGGVDDKVYFFGRTGVSPFTRTAELKLGHPHGNGMFSNQAGKAAEGAPKPMTAGIAVNKSGTVALVANFYNDTVSAIDLKTRRVSSELDLRPGVADSSKTGQPGGTYPYWIAIKGDETAYVSSPRDREIVAVQLGAKPVISGRIAVIGQPNRILLNKAQDKLFVVLDNSDTVGVIDLATSRVISTIGVTAPELILPGKNLPRGANPNSATLSPDEKTLYVTNGGTNSIAVVDVASARTIGLIPTGWYPNSVTISADGKYFYAAIGKSVPGPNRGNCRADVKAPGIPDCSRETDAYVYFLEKGSLLAAPIPPAAELAALTQRTAENNHFEMVRSRGVNPVIAGLREKIRHVIYIVKENRTYDQVLGDLEVGNGDPTIAEFPEPLTPNHHSFARKFVTLDNFYDSGEVSGVGWNWTVAARTTDYTEKSVPANYAGRGFDYDWEGLNRNVNVGIAALPERIKAQPSLAMNGAKADPNLLAGTGDVAAPDSASGDVGSGYLWDEALRAGKTIRNYGFFLDLARYNKDNPGYMPPSKSPFADKAVQASASKGVLEKVTDPYFRGFDQKWPDFYRFKEWEREFDGFVRDGNMPNLTLLRLAHDHFGDFGTAADGINTPALEIADNDYSLGLVLEKLSKSPYAADTLVFIIEDDAQDGPDHVDAHRSLGFVLGPYVKQGAVVSQEYNTVSMVRTMEAILGLEPSSLFAAASGPMTEVFDLNQSVWTYTPIVPDILRNSTLPLPARTAQNSLPQTPAVLAWAKDRHDAKWWQKKSGDMDFEEEDKLDSGRFNRILWNGMMGARPYPTVRWGAALRSKENAPAR